MWLTRAVTKLGLDSAPHDLSSQIGFSWSAYMLCNCRLFQPDWYGGSSRCPFGPSGPEGPKFGIVFHMVPRQGISILESLLWHFHPREPSMFTKTTHKNKRIPLAFGEFRGWLVRTIFRANSERIPSFEQIPGKFRANSGQISSTQPKPLVILCNESPWLADNKERIGFGVKPSMRET